MSSLWRRHCDFRSYPLELWYSSYVWLENRKPLQKCTSDEIDFGQLYHMLGERLDAEEFQRFAFVARQLWFRQNMVVFGGEFTSPSRVNQIATD
jgi:hypothetical protein